MPDLKAEDLAKMNLKAKHILQKVEVNKLPTLPHILLHILNLCNDVKPSFSKLANVLRLDPGLFAKVCAVCFHNHGISPTNFSNKDELSIESAIQKIGISTIKSIVINTAVHQSFSQFASERTAFLIQHWYHSLYCAKVAEALAKACNYRNPDEAYNAGLLHNIGQLVLEATYTVKYTALFEQFDNDDFFPVLEQKAFTTDHQLVGAELLKQQGINSFICDAVLFHHQPIDHIYDAHPLLKIINVANLLTSVEFNAQAHPEFELAEELLGLDKEKIIDLLRSPYEQVKQSAEVLEISSPNKGIFGQSPQQPNDRDQHKQIHLAEQIRDIVLVNDIHQHLSGNKGFRSLLELIEQQISLVFGVNQCLLFAYHKTNKKLNAVPRSNQAQQLADFSITIKKGRSLLADALIDNQITCSFEHEFTELSIIDQQIIASTEHKGIICLPISSGDDLFGVLVLGINSPQYKILRNQITLLKQVGNEIAYSISINKLSSNSTVEENDKNNELQERIRVTLHEVKNPLSIMNNYLSLLGHKLGNDKPVQQDIQTIKSEIDRVSRILNNLTEPKAIPGKAPKVNVNSIISDLTQIFQNSLFTKKNIQITLDLDDRINSMHINENALKQIYTNLINNAVEALSTQGKITVYTLDSINVDGKEHIELNIRDNGPGIDPSIMPLLFSPIQTTKDKNHEGLGLSIVKQLVKDLHGSISCRSDKNGTNFQILIPKE